jgi:preprotein translocase subunit SecG
MYTTLLVIDVIMCIVLVGLILMQHGKGADVGAAFGSGASQTVFGSQGSASFLTRGTAILATLFFVISLWLAYLTGHERTGGSVVDQIPTTPVETGLPTAPLLETLDPAAPGDVPALPAANSVTTTPDDGMSKKSADVPTPGITSE